MADKDLTIGIRAEKETAAIDETAQQLDNLGESAQETQRKLDVLEAQRRVAEREAAAQGNGRGVLGTDVSAAAGGLGQAAADATGFGKEFRAVSQLVSADAVAVTGSIAAIGAALVGAYRMLDDVGSRYDKLRDEFGDDAISEQMAIELEAIRNSLGPLPGIVDLIGEKWTGLKKLIKDPIGEISGANQLEASLKLQAEMAKKLEDTRLRIANENQTELIERFKAEADQLERAAGHMAAMRGLRAEAAGLQEQAAQQEVAIAKQRGGDVALAEANALAVEMAADMERLNNQLADQKQRVVEAAKKADDAMAAYQQGIRDEVEKLDPEKILELSRNVDRSQESLRNVKQEVAQQVQNIEELRRQELADIETKLGAKEQEYAGKTTDAADKAFDAVYEALKTAAEKSGNEAAEKVTTVFNDLKGEQVKFQDKVVGQGTELLGVVKEAVARIGFQADEIAALRAQIQAIGATR